MQGSLVFRSAGVNVGEAASARDNCARSQEMNCGSGGLRSNGFLPHRTTSRRRRDEFVIRATELASPHDRATDATGVDAKSRAL